MEESWVPAEGEQQVLEGWIPEGLWRLWRLWRLRRQERIGAFGVHSNAGGDLGRPDSGLNLD